MPRQYGHMRPGPSVHGRHAGHSRWSSARNGVWATRNGRSPITGRARLRKRAQLFLKNDSIFHWTRVATRPSGKVMRSFSRKHPRNRSLLDGCSATLPIRAGDHLSFECTVRPVGSKLSTQMSGDSLYPEGRLTHVVGRLNAT